MRGRFSRCAIGSVLAVGAPVALADMTEDRGWFVEASVLEAESSGDEALYAFDGEEPGRALLGGYAFNRYLAIEAGYRDFGEHFGAGCAVNVCAAIVPSPQPDQLVDIEGVSVAALGTWRVAEKVEVFGKLGVLAWDADFRPAGFDESDNSALVGAGVGIWITPSWRLNVQYERVDFDLESAGVGVTYRF